MISLLKEYLDKPFDSLYRDVDETLKVRIRITNTLIIVGIIIIFLFTLQNAFMLKFFLAFVFNFITIIFFILSLRWNLNGQYRLGITVFTFSVMIAAILPGCFLPYLPNYEYIFLALVGAPIILIPSDMKI